MDDKGKAVINFEIDILGTKYQVYVYEEQTEYMKDKDYGAYIMYSTKEIYVSMDDFYRENLCHEILHAFMFECGLMPDGEINNERVTEFLSLQFQKINGIVTEANIISNEKYIEVLTERKNENEID